MARRHVRVQVFGRVQGVGFRYFTQSVGRNLGLAGYVRNEPDGSVTAEAEGEAATVEQFLLQVGQGPAHAAVERVTVEELPCQGDPPGQGRGGSFGVR